MNRKEQTGTGKTASYGIPVIQKTDASSKQTQAIILSPTRGAHVDFVRRLLPGVAVLAGDAPRDVTVGKHGLVGGRDGAREEGGRAEKRISGVADHFGDLLGLGTPSFFPRPLPR